MEDLHSTDRQGVGVGGEEQGSSNSLPGSNLRPTICWLWDLGEFLSLSVLQFPLLKDADKFCRVKGRIRQDGVCE